MAQTAQPTQIVSANSLAAMSAQQRAAYFNSLSPEEASTAQANYAAYVDKANRTYMALAIKKTALCPPSAGGITQAYSAGATLTWDFPTAGGAFADALIFTMKLTVTTLAGTGAAYAINQAAPLSVIDNIQILLNGVQNSLRPFILKYVGQLRGYGRSQEPTSVLAGQKSTTIESNLNNGGTYPAAAGAGNVWNFVFRLPLNVLAENNPAGMLPMQAAGTKPQVVLTCAPAAMGNDPILHPLRTTAGTGAGVTITGTIQVDAEYRDGTNLFSTQALALDLSQAPTVQYIRDSVFNNIAASNVQRTRITTLLQHYMVLVAVCDGTTAGQFVSGLSNIQILELDMDSVGQNVFYRYGTGTNLSIYDFYEKLRRDFGQDVDDGIVPWVVGWGNLVTNSDNRDGAAFLNMMSGGWPDVNHGVQVGTVGAVYTPRVECYLISLNPAGLKLVQL